MIVTYHAEPTGLCVVRDGSVRLTSWNTRHWQPEYLDGGNWRRYPDTADTDPTRGELYREGRAVLAALLPHTRRTWPYLWESLC